MGGFRGSFARTSSAVAHPFLFTLFPVAFLHRRNLDQTQWQDVARVGILVVAIAVALFLVIRLLTRDRHRAGVAVSGLALIALSYGHAREATAGIRIAGLTVGSDALLLPAWALLVIAVRWVATRSPGSGRRIDLSCAHPRSGYGEQRSSRPNSSLSR